MCIWGKLKLVKTPTPPVYNVINISYQKEEANNTKQADLGWRKSNHFKIRKKNCFLPVSPVLHAENVVLTTNVGLN